MHNKKIGDTQLVGFSSCLSPFNVEQFIIWVFIIIGLSFLFSFCFWI